MQAGCSRVAGGVQAGCRWGAGGVQAPCRIHAGGLVLMLQEGLACMQAGWPCCFMLACRPAAGRAPAPCKRLGPALKPGCAPCTPLHAVQAQGRGKLRARRLGGMLRPACVTAVHCLAALCRSRLSCGLGGSRSRVLCGEPPLVGLGMHASQGYAMHRRMQPGWVESASQADDACAFSLGVLGWTPAEPAPLRGCRVLASPTPSAHPAPTQNATQPPSHPFIHPPIHPRTHPLTHPPTHPPVPCCSAGGAAGAALPAAGAGAAVRRPAGSGATHRCVAAGRFVQQYEVSVPASKPRYAC